MSPDMRQPEFVANKHRGADQQDNPCSVTGPFLFGKFKRILMNYITTEI